MIIFSILLINIRSFYKSIENIYSLSIYLLYMYQQSNNYISINIYHSAFFLHLSKIYLSPIFIYKLSMNYLSINYIFLSINNQSINYLLTIYIYYNYPSNIYLSRCLSPRRSATTFLYLSTIFLYLSIILLYLWTIFSIYQQSIFQLYTYQLSINYQSMNYIFLSINYLSLSISYLSLSISNLSISYLPLSINKISISYISLSINNLYQLYMNFPSTIYLSRCLSPRRLATTFLYLTTIYINYLLTIYQLSINYISTIY